MGAHDLGAKARANGIDHITIQGMDVMSVYDGMKPFVDQCRENSRPGFVDMQTYRFKGHSMSDPRKYRTHEEEQSYETQDPIETLSKFLVKTGVLEEPAIKAMSKEVRSEIRAAVKWAEESPEPDLSELYHDVYVEQWGPYSGTSFPQFMQDESKGDA